MNADLAVHSHRDVITLTESRAVTASSFSPDAPYVRLRRPSFGLYFDTCWSPPWPHHVLDWPDMSVPPSLSEFDYWVDRVADTCAADRRVELGCVGGHGRTGTFLACLAWRVVVTPGFDPILFTRRQYCANALETAAQERFVETYTRRVPRPADNP